MVFSCCKVLDGIFEIGEFGIEGQINDFLPNREDANKDSQLAHVFPCFDGSCRFPQNIKHVCQYDRSCNQGDYPGIGLREDFCCVGIKGFAFAEQIENNIRVDKNLLIHISSQDMKGSRLGKYLFRLRCR